MPKPPLTLIVATTPYPCPAPPNGHPKTLLGIGLNGTLPWPRIKSDMSFFARVTSRPPLSNTAPGTGPGAGRAVRTNALIMGRKTYDSVPGKLRPLGKRVSVVVSRDREGVVRDRVRGELERKRERERELAEAKAQAQTQAQSVSTATGTTTTAAPAEGRTDAFVVSSLEEALTRLDTAVEEGTVGNIFVIGGAEIYGASLKIGSEAGAGAGTAAAARKVRIVITDVEKLDGSGFECDTFFPITGGDLAGEGWRRVSPEELTGWVGEEVTGEWIEEGDVRVRMVGYERVDS
ncbi:dihydrofolate reductase-like domain-containing protein [Aspergillus aurantiobrunneus]